jgi:protease I
VIRGRKITTIPKCRLDVEVCGAVYVEAPVVASGNLLSARGKKDMSAWMQAFVPMIADRLTPSKTRIGTAPST